MNTSENFNRLKTQATMPSPSRIVRHIMHGAGPGASSPPEIAASLESEGLLSAALLDYINAASDSAAGQVDSTEQATVKLGVPAVASLALGFSLFLRHRTGQCSTFDYRGFWARSLARAAAVRSLASLAGESEVEPLFVCGLLGDIGSLALASLFPVEYALMLAERLDDEELLLRESEEFTVNHYDMSGELLRSWNIPNDRVAAVTGAARYRTDTALVPGDTTLCRLFRLAWVIGDICMLEAPLQDKILLAETLARGFGLAPDDFGDRFDAIVDQWQRWGHRLDILAHDFPLYRQIKEMDRTIRTSSRHSPTTGQMRILVADDDPMTVLSLCRLLQRKNNVVYTAEDGETALALAERHLPHLVITDWRMPKLNGIELCHRLRNGESTRHVYIIMLTGRESPDELVEALEAGADDFVVKPFANRVLEARIRSGARIVSYQRTITRDREIIRQYAARLAAANRTLENLAMTDVLTGLPNRRSAFSRLKEVVAEYRRYREPLCCIMVDIDHFKAVNDTYGHDVGDKVLRELATIFNTSARSYDMVSRIGGEEFLIICARSGLDDSRQLAERLRGAVENHRIEHEGVPIRTTISLGVASWCNDMRDGEDMTKAADRALYRAKQNGRNRVEVERPAG